MGESANGDAVVVRESGGAILVAVIDALGHGPKAADVAKTSVEFLTATADLEDANVLIRGLHHVLQASRGAAGLILLISEKGLASCSVGNVELRSVTGKLPFVLT